MVARVRFQDGVAELSLVPSDGERTQATPSARTASN
jgi:hypothetical protein